MEQKVQSSCFSTLYYYFVGLGIFFWKVTEDVYVRSGF